MKKALVIGATGAMGTYLTPELLKKGFAVDGVTLDRVESNDPRLTYLTFDARDPDKLAEQLKNHYDCVVDFMNYFSVEEFRPLAELFLANTEQYIFLSTARVYANVQPAREDSLLIIDADMPESFVREREYCIYKAEEERFLRASGRNNFTIVRPTITYSKNRFQLTILEADVVIRRMLEGKTVLLPEGAIDRECTLTWAGDTAKMFSAVIGCEKALGETYTLTTAEHLTWRQVAGIYHEIGGLRYRVVDDETFLSLFNPGSVASRQQLLYSRNYDRTYDNSKILALSGLRQEEMTSPAEGLRRELAGVTPEAVGDRKETNERMDAYLREHPEIV